MSLKVLLRDQPQRSIAVATDSHALVFRPSQPSSNPQRYGLATQSPPPRCMVEFNAINVTDLDGYRPLRTQGAYGTLGLITINTDVFLCIISGSSSVATVRPGENVQRIVSVEFYCLNRSDFDHELHDEINRYSTDSISPDGFELDAERESQEAQLEHPCLALKRILSSGTFYYSVNFDLRNRLQDRLSEESAFDVDSLEESFLWNSFMIDPLIHFRSRLAIKDKGALDASRILTSAIRGYVATITIPASSSPLKAIKTNYPSMLTVISRLSCRRAGTRFNARGVDDDGNVANFVETEIVFWHPSSLCFSYSQIRGSVPVFWEQASGLLPGQQKIEVTRSPEATQPAFDKHFEELELNYGVIHVLNLLSESKSSEAELTKRYKMHLHNSPLSQSANNRGISKTSLLSASQFDFHAETRGPGGYEAASAVRQIIESYAEGFAYCMVEDTKVPMAEDILTFDTLSQAPTVVLQQEGVFRTNCLDCLDRTNLIQTIINQMVLESFLRHRNEHASPDFWMRHSTLWADNGDALSKIYAGTGALKSSFTRHGKMSLGGALADARKSVTRMYINNFADKGRQNTIDLLLGRLVDQIPVYLFDPINDYVTTELAKRTDEYSSSELVHIWAGSFNLNGRGNGAKEDLSTWLCSNANRLQRPAEIVAVGFQEIVELSPQQIMSTDPARRQEWETAVGRTLNENARKSRFNEYVLLRSGQLVGAALMIFVQSHILKMIKNVEGSVKKTGMSGMAGNKGAVGIRMDYADTRICFVTAHLAAGFANYEERNRDYRTISHGLRFQRNRSINDHDTIIWLGDFNYRIGLSDEKVRRLIEIGDLDTLYANDQLNLQMVAGRTFQFYSEATITFHPTYKYNNGTDDYDTSEKSRIPAWCDRVLRKGDNLRQTDYATAPLRFSDHRPVYATFQCSVNVVDTLRKERLSLELYNIRRAEIGNDKTNATTSEKGDSDLLGFEPRDSSLPRASSDSQKWWLKNGLPASSTIAPPGNDSKPNPNRPSNPFAATDVADWVLRPGPQKQSLANQTLINDNSNALSSQSARKVPPPYNLDPLRLDSAKSEDLVNIPDDGARTSNAASITSVSRKPAPPIPKKPPLLTSTRSQQEGIGGSWEDQLHPAHRGRDSLLASSQATSMIHRDNVSFHTPSQRYTKKTQKSPAHEQPPLPCRPPPFKDARLDHSAGQRPPSLPPRGNHMAESLGGLLDDDDDRMRLIPSLEPLRRR